MGTTGHTSERPAAGRFPSLAPGLATATPIAGRRATGVMVSLTLHAALVAAAILLPLVFYNALPAASTHEAHAFFAEPLDLAPPPPPPPPPPAQARRVVPRRAPIPPHVDTTKLVAPLKVPDVLPVPEASLDLGLGVEGGVPGGVAGGVPGGVVGGIVGGLPLAPPPPPPPRVVRVGGNISAPALLRRVDPVYPDLAREARVQGVVILEARVDTRGRVAALKVLRGQPLLDEAAVTAVRQWRYRPLLLNGEPTEFILTVTVNFQLR
jgi:periplasmic protein TonB